MKMHECFVFANPAIHGVACTAIHAWGMHCNLAQTSAVRPRLTDGSGLVSRLNPSAAIAGGGLVLVNRTAFVQVRLQRRLERLLIRWNRMEFDPVGQPLLQFRPGDHLQRYKR